MKTVYLIDDDFISRSKIRSLIDWENEGYRIVGEAENGREALCFLRESAPDILLLDMDMPETDGLELLTQLKQEKIACAVIVLSAYDDYKYVRSSMKMGALEYLLKNTLTSSQLLETLHHVDNRLSQSQEAERQAAYYFLPDKLHQILLGIDQDTRDVYDFFEKHGIKEPFCLAIAELDNYRLICANLPNFEGARLSAAFFELIRNGIQGKPGLIATKMGDNVVAILAGLSVMDRASFVSQIQNLSRSIRQMLNLTASFCIGKSVNASESLAAQYEILLRSLQSKLYQGNCLIIDVMPPAKDEKKPPFQFSLEIEKSFTRALNSGDYPDAHRILDAVCDSLLQGKEPLESIRRIGCQIISVLCTLCKQHQIRSDQVFDGDDPYAHFCLLETVEDMRRYLQSACETYIRILSDVEAVEGYNPITLLAIQYLRKNYAHPVSLGLVAKNISTNSSYLSRVFKKDTGVNFIEYLNRLRIRKAMEKIRESPDISIKQIALETGYINYNHFFSEFKKETGISPVLYQKNIKAAASQE